MRILLAIIVCVTFSPSDGLNAQGQNSSQFGRNMRIQKLVRDVLSKTVTLNFKESSPRTGILVKADAIEFVLESDSTEEKYPTSGIRSITIGPGVSEGLLVALAGVLCAGFGIGAATLSFDGMSSGAQTAVAAVFGLFGGWIGYGSFFQVTELQLP